MSSLRPRLAPLALLTALVALGVPARADKATDGPAALLAWRTGAGRDQLRRMEKRLGELAMDSAVRSLVAEVDLSPPEARLTVLITGALKLRARAPDAQPDCPKRALHGPSVQSFEWGLLSDPPTDCAPAGGSAVWGDGRFPQLEADARREAVVAWLETRPGSDWADPEARARADWYALLEGQVAAEILRTLGEINGLASADMEKLEATMRAVGDSLPGIVGADRALRMNYAAGALLHLDADQRLQLLMAGVTEALQMDGRHLSCAKALDALVTAEPDAPAPPGLETCAKAAEEARRSTGRGEPLPGVERAAKQKGASALMIAAGPAWSLLDSYSVWTTYEDENGEQADLREAVLRALGEAVPPKG